MTKKKKFCGLKLCNSWTKIKLKKSKKGLKNLKCFDKTYKKSIFYLFLRKYRGVQTSWEKRRLWIWKVRLFSKQNMFFILLKYYSNSDKSGTKMKKTTWFRWGRKCPWSWKIWLASFRPKVQFRTSKEKLEKISKPTHEILKFVQNNRVGKLVYLIVSFRFLLYRTYLKK